MALSKTKIKTLLQDTLIKFYTDIFKPDLDGHTHKYAGSSTVGGAATSANKVNKSLTIQANGTSLASFNGSSAKTVNITPSNIGAAASSHTHNYAGSSSAGGAANSANKVNNQLNIVLKAIQGGTRVAFDGSASQTILINPANIGATTESYVNSSISALDLYDDNNNIYVKNSAGTLGSGLHGTIVRYIAPTSFSEFLEMTQNPGVYYVQRKITTTYNNKTVTILGLIDSRKSGSNYSYYGIQKMNQFVVNSSGQITNYSQLTEYILNQIPNTYAGSSSAGGSATSAEKVNHKLTITNYDLDINESFDGSADISLDLTPDTLGAAWKDHGTHVTFSTTAPKANGTAAVGTATAVSRSDHVHPLQTSVSGNAGTATKLATARTISLTGDVTGSITFDGSANKSITASIPIPVSGNWFKGFAKVNTDGVVEVGKYIDFHNTNNSTDDYNTRIACNNTGTNTLTLPTASGTIALTSDISSAIGNINTLLDELNGTSV